MTSLDRAHYAAIATGLARPWRAFVDGDWSTACEAFDTVNPATGEAFAAVPHCNVDDVDHAVRAARRSVATGNWARQAPELRKEVLLDLAALIRANAQELAVLESLDSGKPIRDCLKEIGEEVPACFQWYAELIDKSFGKVAPTGEQAWAMIVKEPVGVVGLVLPWNFPLLMAAWKLAPALAAGCSVVVKPAEQTSLTALRLAELATQAGVPAGVINVVPGLGETTGRAIGCHPDIDAVSFTGSTDVGRHFLRYAAETNLKTVGLEMGGKSPFIVLDDADLSEGLIENAAMSAFWNAGQNCSANMRQIVGRRHHDDFVHAVIRRADAIVIGDPLDPRTEMGPLVSAEHHGNVSRYLEVGRHEGATTALDRAVREGPGSFMGPTVFTGLTPAMTIAREEIFGPVLGVLQVEGLDEAIQVANDSDYGLHATVYTRDLDAAMHVANRLECGTVAINGFTEGDMKTPFGGYKRSGSLARDKGVEALDQYLHSKTIWITNTRS